MYIVEFHHDAIVVDDINGEIVVEPYYIFPSKLQLIIYRSKKLVCQNPPYSKLIQLS